MRRSDRRVRRETGQSISEANHDELFKNKIKVGKIKTNLVGSVGNCRFRAAVAGFDATGAAEIATGLCRTTVSGWRPGDMEDEEEDEDGLENGDGAAVENRTFACAGTCQSDDDEDDGVEQDGDEEDDSSMTSMANCDGLTGSANEDDDEFAIVDKFSSEIETEVRCACDNLASAMTSLRNKQISATPKLTRLLAAPPSDMRC